MAKNNATVAPINHSTTSAVATTAAETGKGGFKGLLKGVLTLPMFGAAIGGLIGVASLVSGITAALSAPVISATGATLAAGSAAAIFSATTAGLGAAVATIAVGGGLGLVAMFIPFVGPALTGLAMAVFGLFGAAKGFGKGTEQVAQERGAAAMYSTQIEMERARAISASAPAPIYAESRVNNASSVGSQRVQPGIVQQEAWAEQVVANKAAAAQAQAFRG